MANVFDILGGKGRRSQETPDVTRVPDENEHGIHTEFQEEEIEKNLKVLESAGIQAEKIERKVEKSVSESLELLGADAAKRIHVISRGFCPDCGTKLKQHLYTNICLGCGWNQYTVPPKGPIVLHLNDGNKVEGDTCYNLKTGDILVLKEEVVIARVKKSACDWIHYNWSEDDLIQKKDQHLKEQKQVCSWCEGDAIADEDGFSVIYIALGTYQNRYIFCGNDCLEAFRDQYPSRVHRNCYETDCEECNMCVKRYDTTWDSYQVVQKGKSSS